MIRLVFFFFFFFFFVFFVIPSCSMAITVKPARANAAVPSRVISRSLQSPRKIDSNGFQIMDKICLSGSAIVRSDRYYDTSYDTKRAPSWKRRLGTRVLAAHLDMRLHKVAINGVSIDPCGSNDRLWKDKRRSYSILKSAQLRFHTKEIFIILLS